jgi:hypothetical protein
MKYIYSHLGLGDHIICNGAVHFYQEKYGEVTVFSKQHNLANVEKMYRHNDKITVMAPYGGDHDDYVKKYIEENGIFNDTIYIGFWKLDPSDPTTFDVQFYLKNDLPWDYRFNYFKFERDTKKENEVFEELNPNNEDYIFVHGPVDHSKIRQDLKIIENPIHHGIFDILKLMENATECHMMESSIKCLVNSFKFENPKFFYHEYVRGYTPWFDSKGINNWTIIK